MAAIRVVRTVARHVLSRARARSFPPFVCSRIAIHETKTKDFPIHAESREPVRHGIIELDLREAVMTVRLELKPEVEAALADQARAKGVSLDTYLQNVMEDLACAPATPRHNVERFRAALDRLAEMGKNLPHLPSSAFTREGIYQDHD